jgi:hypothetical protein
MGKKHNVGTVSKYNTQIVENSYHTNTFTAHFSGLVQALQ